MPTLADTNVLLRSLQSAHPMHVEAWRALRILKRREDLVIAPQNIVEMWVVATRPIAQNGLGISPTAASGYLNRFRRFLPLVPDTSDVHDQWERLVAGYSDTPRSLCYTREASSKRETAIQIPFPLLS
jgi:predicted nucleic acid-binding protein